MYVINDYDFELVLSFLLLRVLRDLVWWVLVCVGDELIVVIVVIVIGFLGVNLLLWLFLILKV